MPRRSNIVLKPIRGGAKIGPVALSLRTDDLHLMLDCGADRNGRAAWSSAVDDLDACWVSHVHNDHIGGLPDLLMGRPRLDCVGLPGTARLADYALRAHPNCDGERAADIANGLRAVEPRTWFELPRRRLPDEPSVRAMVFPAGHMLGAGMLLLEIPTDGEPYRLLYTGDFCCHDQPLVSGAALPKPTDDFRIDALVMEGVLATDRGADGVDYDEELEAFCDWMAGREGPGLVAVNALGESVELAAALAERGVEPVLHDDLAPVLEAYRGASGVERAGSPRSSLEATTVAEPGHALSFLNEGRVVLAPGDQLGRRTPAHDLAGAIFDNPRARIAVTNRAYDGTTAGELLAAGEGDRIDALGAPKPLRAAIRRFTLPTHAPRWQLTGTVAAVDPDTVVLVHGKASRLHALGRAIRSRGFDGELHVPSDGERLELG